MGSNKQTANSRLCQLERSISHLENQIDIIQETINKVREAMDGSGKNGERPKKGS